MTSYGKKCQTQVLNQNKTIYLLPFFFLYLSLHYVAIGRVVLDLSGRYVKINLLFRFATTKYVLIRLIKLHRKKETNQMQSHK